MERTKVISVVNNTAKAPKNQGFLEKCFRSGHSFSSAARYDRFDNSPCHICNISLKKTFGKRRELTAPPYSKAFIQFFQESEMIFSRKVANLSGKG